MKKINSKLLEILTIFIFYITLMLIISSSGIIKPPNKKAGLVYMKNIISEPMIEKAKEIGIDFIVFVPSPSTKCEDIECYSAVMDDNSFFIENMEINPERICSEYNRKCITMGEITTLKDLTKYVLICDKDVLNSIKQDKCVLKKNMMDHRIISQVIISLLALSYLYLIIEENSFYS